MIWYYLVCVVGLHIHLLKIITEEMVKIIIVFHTTQHFKQLFFSICNLLHTLNSQRFVSFFEAREKEKNDCICINSYFCSASFGWSLCSIEIHIYGNNQVNLFCFSFVNFLSLSLATTWETKQNTHLYTR